MNRFMVILGLGSLLLISSAAQAEMPRYYHSAVVPGQPSASSIIWHDSLESGWEEARKRNLPMVIYITTDHCHYCEAMKRDTWCETTVAQRVGQSFVAIRLTPQQNAATLGRIRVAMYPMTLVGIPQGKIVAHRLGYQPAASLHQLLGEAKSRITRR